MATGRRVLTMAAIREANEALGHHFFEPAAMRFFRSRIEGGPYGYTGYFVTSEQFDSDSPRLYTIRHANEDGSIATVGEFQAYATRAAAVAEARYLARDEGGE